ncbi:prolyl 4-Hydroxylase alpha-subunit, region [Cooperia oncophora]
MQNVVGLLALLLVAVHADLFTSVADMQGLLDSEKSIPALLHKYIENERVRLSELKKLAEVYTARNEEALKTGAKDIANPINAFLLIKQKIFDWKGIEQKMLLNKADSFIERIQDANYGIRYPTEVSKSLSSSDIHFLPVVSTIFFIICC